MPRVAKKVARRRGRPRKPRARILKVGIMGRAIQEIALTSDMTVEQLAENQNLDYTSVVGLDSNGDETDLADDDIVNGYDSVIFTPAVDGGQ